MKNLFLIAGKTIPVAGDNKKLLYKNGNTKDIVKAILYADSEDRKYNYLKQFAPNLTGATLEETCFNIWSFIKSNIRYKEDPAGEQWVKSPAQLWKDKQGDCKSFSLFVSGVLRALKIPYYYRFVSWEHGAQLKHVYVIVPSHSKPIIIDAVYYFFNREKNYAYKKDITVMTKISYISGIGCTQQVNGLPQDHISVDLGSDKNWGINGISEAEMELRLAKDALITEKNLLNRIAGIGNAKNLRYENSIDFFDDAIRAVRISGGNSEIAEHNLAVVEQNYLAGLYSAPDIGKLASNRKKRGLLKKIVKLHTAPLKLLAKTHTAPLKALANLRKGRKITYGLTDNVISGKKKPKAKAAAQTATPLLQQAAKPTGKKKKLGKSKVGKGLKKLVKGAGKVAVKAIKTGRDIATFPVKVLLEKTLPKASTFFLYSFITNKDTVNTLPKKVQAKRKKSNLVKDFIVKGIGMKEDHFNKLVRNGITKQYAMSPESYLSKSVTGNIAGIGILPAAIPAILSILGAVSKLFKKKAPQVSEGDAPDPESDFKGIAPIAKQKISKAIKQNIEKQAEYANENFERDTMQQEITEGAQDESGNIPGSISPQSNASNLRLSANDSDGEAEESGAVEGAKAKGKGQTEGNKTLLKAGIVAAVIGGALLYANKKR